MEMGLWIRGRRRSGAETSYGTCKSSSGSQCGSMPFASCQRGTTYDTASCECTVIFSGSADVVPPSGALKILTVGAHRIESD